MSSKSFRPDARDRMILEAMLRLGGKATAEELARPMGMPARTLRHRIQRLKQEGYLKQLLLQTNDVRLGLGDSFLFLQMSEHCTSLPLSLLERVPIFYDFSSSYGRYNGYCVHLAYSITAPDTGRRVCEFMKTHDIVSDYAIFDNVDIHIRSPDLGKLSVARGWNADWKSWVADYRNTTETSDESKTIFDTSPTSVDFDRQDLDIIMRLKEDASKSTRNLSKGVGLSASQIAHRIRRLEDLGIIKGSRWVMHESQQPLYFDCVFETMKENAAIVDAFENLPIPVDLFAETGRRFCARLHLEPRDLIPFLDAFNEMKEGLRSFFFQTQHDRRSPIQSVRRLYESWDPDSKRWELPVDKSIEELAAFAESLQ